MFLIIVKGHRMALLQLLTLLMCYAVPEDPASSADAHHDL